MSRPGCLLLCFFSQAAGLLSPICCGDNFCCALMEARTIECWGGSSYGTAPIGHHKAIACGGKQLLAVGDDDRLSACEGTPGYGLEGCRALLGIEVMDISVSYWGGSLVTSNGSMVSWSQEQVYGSDAVPTFDECALISTPSACTARSMHLHAPAGTFSGVACGGHSAGHFCCGLRSESSTHFGTSGTLCWGDEDGQNTPAEGAEWPPGGQHSISAGIDFVCTLDNEGHAGTYGRLVEGALASSAHPFTVAPPDNTFSRYMQAVCGSFTETLLSSDGEAQAFGRVFGVAVGQVEAGTDPTELPPGASFKFLANGGFAHGCGVDEDDTVQCWGADFAGQVSHSNFRKVVTGDDVHIYPQLLSRVTTPRPVEITHTPSAPRPTQTSGGGNVVPMIGLVLGALCVLGVAIVAYFYMTQRKVKRKKTGPSDSQSREVPYGGFSDPDADLSAGE